MKFDVAAVINMNPRRIFHIRLDGDRLLPVQVDIYDDRTMHWMNDATGPLEFGIQEFVKTSLCKDFPHILSKETGVIKIPNVVSYKFELVEDPRPRRDHVLLYGSSPTMMRPEIFPYLLKIMLYHPEHVF